MTTLDKTAAFFDANYYQSGCGLPYERSPHWLGFFGTIADQLVSTVGPHSVLDAGCAKGFLVEALRDRGVEAYGVDLSEYAIGQVRSDMKPYCWVGSVATPLARRFDLIVCIEILEHVSPEEGRQAIANFCRATDDIIFSSSPVDYREATHFNVRPPEYWAELFAEQGFVRDVDFDAVRITPWAVRFRKNSEPWVRVLQAYERKFWPLWHENWDLRQVNLELRQQVQALQKDKEQMAQSFAAETEKVKSSPGWQLLETLEPLRRWGMPPGSRRERWVRWGMQRVHAFVRQNRAS